MSPWARRAIIYDLPAYVAGTLAAPRRAAVAAALAAEPALQAEHDRLAGLATALQAADPATPPDGAQAAQLRALLQAELARRPARRPWRAAGLPAWAAAGLLFAAGLLTGARLFPREVVHEVVRDRPVTVAVAVPVRQPVMVEKVVEKRVEVRVEVPVERVVTRWRTRVVTRPAPAARAVGAPAAGATPGPARPPAEIVTLPDDLARRPDRLSVALAGGERPEAVEF